MGFFRLESTVKTSRRLRDLTFLPLQAGLRKSWLTAKTEHLTQDGERTHSAHLQ